ncbi:MAG: GntR family transcriptional regulator, partial [Cytophagales bacterium]|nr:GntR family transcriptional regulator [Armatimonadota bacterium]
MSNTRWNEILSHLRAEIESGARKPGDRLPSEVEIAAEWQVCRMTAHRAMSELTREGWVTRKRRAGTIVAPPRVPEPVVKVVKAVRHVALLCFHSNDFPQADYVHGFRTGL